jgi:MFS family permease
VPGVLLPIILFIIVGVPNAGIGVGFNTLVQTGVADEFRGRIFGAISAASALAMLVGAALAGALGDRIGILPLLNAEGILDIVAGLLVLAVVATTTTSITKRPQTSA